MKSTLRSRYLDVRRNLPPADRAEAAEEVCRRVLGLMEDDAPGTVSVYWPLVERGELDTRPLVRDFMGMGSRVVLPVITERQPPTLVHREFESERELVTNWWGISEPRGPDVPLEEIDLIIVPAVAAGRNLHRIGQGKGYYDRLLAGATARTACVVYHECLLDEVPTEPHDMPLDAVVTQRETLVE